MFKLNKKVVLDSISAYAEECGDCNSCSCTGQACGCLTPTQLPQADLDNQGSLGSGRNAGPVQMPYNPSPF